MLRDDTIAALSTPPGEGAVAIVRVSGAEAGPVLTRVFAGRDPAATPRCMVAGSLACGHGNRDRGMAVFFRGPASYTGEDMAELHCHGGVHVAAGVLGAALEAGARAAEPGEFSMRAFLHGKMDLTQAEAVMDVIRARTPLALRAAQEQLSGRLGVMAETARARLLGLVANVEAWIDFPDEDIDPATGAAFAAAIRACIAEMDALIETADSGRLLREGAGIVLWGAPNAGKSSLLNRLLGFDRAIVDAAPGTTRDTIEEWASLGGYPFRITDTAGLRDAEGTVERLGIERARRAIEAADVPVRVVDAADGPWEHRPGELVALNKCDLLAAQPSGLPNGIVAISCATGDGLPALVAEILARAGALPGRPSAAAINARHHACLVRARGGLARALDDLDAGRSPELVAPGLHEALEAIGEMTGAADTEEILGAIFARFCLGK